MRALAGAVLGGDEGSSGREMGVLESLVHGEHWRDAGVDVREDLDPVGAGSASEPAGDDPLHLRPLFTVLLVGESGCVDGQAF